MNIYEVILFAAVIGNAWDNVLTEEGHVFAFGLSSFLWILTALGAIVLGGFITKLWHL